MSRYDYPMNNKNHKGCIGWDILQSTFFLIVKDESKPEDDEEYFLEYMGRTSHEVHDLKILLRTARLYGEISEDLEQRLSNDAQNRYGPVVQYHANGQNSERMER